MRPFGSNRDHQRLEFIYADNTHIEFTDRASSSTGIGSDDPEAHFVHCSQMTPFYWDQKQIEPTFYRSELFYLLVSIAYRCQVVVTATQYEMNTSHLISFITTTYDFIFVARRASYYSFRNRITFSETLLCLETA